MSLRISVDAVLDDSQAKSQQAELEVANEKIANAITENEKKTKEAYQLSLGAMRASYMMVSGISQVIGGGMGQIFSTLYGVAVAGITTYQSIAAAMAASGPAGWIQATLMTSSLIAALISLGSLAAGQTELASQVSGLNMVIQGFGGLLDSMPFG